MADKMNPDDSPTALFCVLESAIRSGDFRLAAEIQERLKAIGYTVIVRRRRRRTKSGEGSQ